MRTPSSETNFIPRELVQASFGSGLSTDLVESWFIPGVSPIKTCTVHREVLVDVATGLRLPVDDGTRDIRRDVYEFWPGYLLSPFQRAGVARRLPPPFLPGTPAEFVARSGNAPSIISP